MSARLVEEFLQRAHEAAIAFSLPQEIKINLLNISENVTYKLEDPVNHKKYALRLNRAGYNSVSEIRSELYWIEQVREIAGIHIPAFFTNSQGESILTLNDQVTTAVLFEFIEGSEPENGTLIKDFRSLGEIAAKMHVFSREFVLPKDFQRFSWDFKHMVGVNGRWGNWETDGIDISAQVKHLLREVSQKIERELNDYGINAEKFGLIHGDMRLTNIIKSKQGMYLIDFDDSGFSWYIYDLAASLSFIEVRPKLNELINSWIVGYTKIRKLSADDREIIPTMIMLRRLLLLAWVGTHQFSPYAKKIGPSFTNDTYRLGERYLANSLL